MFDLNAVGSSFYSSLFNEKPFFLKRKRNVLEQGKKNGIDNEEIMSLNYTFMLYSKQWPNKKLFDVIYNIRFV